MPPEQLPETSTLRYRTPGVGAHRVAAVAAMLELAEALGLVAAAGKTAAGIPLTLVGPLLVATLVTGIARRTAADQTYLFQVVFSIACVAVVPLLMWHERRTRGRFFEDAVRGETGTRGASSYGEYELQAATFLWTAYVEVALLGPRLLWHVWDWARGTPRVGPAVRAAAAEVVVDLLDAGEGVPVRRLVRPGRSLAEIHWAIRYLVEQDWAGVSRRRDRVWLTTPVREKLEHDLRGAAGRPPAAMPTARQRGAPDPRATGPSRHL